MKASYTLYARTDKKNKRNEAPIYLRITYNRKSRYVNTGIKVPEKDWNDSREEVRRSHPSQEVYNQELERLKLNAEQIGFELDKRNKVSAKIIADELKGKKPTDFVKFTKNYIDHLKKTGSVRRSKQTKVILNKIIDYSNTENIEFPEINKQFLDSLQNYLADEYDNHPNTIRKDFERLKMVFQEADENGILNENVFLRYKLPPRQKTKKEALTFEQVKAIEALDLKESTRTWHVRNYFMFSFYNAGIRFGDLCKLKWKNIEDGRLKYLMSKSKNNKSPKWKNIKLNDHSYEILKHYRTTGSEQDYIFPILGPEKDNDDPVVFDREKSRNNALVNKALKKIAKKAGIELSLSFHISRHSFARHAANMGMNIYAISNALAHSDLKTTQVYLNEFNESLLDKEMDSIF